MRTSLRKYVPTQIKLQAHQKEAEENNLQRIRFWTCSTKKACLIFLQVPLFFFNEQ